MNIDQLDKKTTAWMKKEGVLCLRYSLAIVFIWFGALKPLGLSPAAELISHTVFYFHPDWVIPILGAWEVIIGVSLLYKPFIKTGLVLMAIQMWGTFLPLFLLPDVVFTSFPFVLTLEGQYIIKNIVLISAGMVVGSHARD